jgi:hypothetical protein
MTTTVRSGRRSELLLSSIGAVAVIAFIVFALVVAVPPSIANLTSTVSDGVTPQTLQDGDLGAAVVVPEGWVVRRQGDDALSVVTPDGALTARLALTADDPETAISGSGDGTLRTEVLASGLTVVHADNALGSVVAAVVARGGDTVTVFAEVDDPQVRAVYRPALAQLLEGIVP